MTRTGWNILPFNHQIPFPNPAELLTPHVDRAEASQMARLLNEIAVNNNLPPPPPLINNFHDLPRPGIFTPPAYHANVPSPSRVITEVVTEQIPVIHPDNWQQEPSTIDTMRDLASRHFPEQNLPSPPPPIDPLPIEDPSNGLPKSTQNKNTGSLGGALKAAVGAVASNPEKFIRIVPLVVMMLANSMEENLTNVRLYVTATETRKIYYIALSRNQGFGSSEERGVTFEVTEGGELRFLHDIDATYSSESQAPLFETQSAFDYSLGPIKHLKHNRQRDHTVLDILVADSSDNPSLRDGPRVYTIPLSSRETIRIVHTSPERQEDPIITPGDHVEYEDPTNRWTRIGEISLAVSDPLSPNNCHSTQRIPLEGLNPDKPQKGRHLIISQKVEEDEG